MFLIDVLGFFDAGLVRLTSIIGSFVILGGSISVDPPRTDEVSLLGEGGSNSAEGVKIFLGETIRFNIDPLLDWIDAEEEVATFLIIFVSEC